MDKKKLMLLLGALVIAIGTAMAARSLFMGAAAPTAEEVNRLRESIVQQLGVLNGTVPAPPPYRAAQARTAGETKYTLRKMLRLALDGVTSFSVMPLRVISARSPRGRWRMKKL